MAHYVPNDPPGLIVELGAGTGAITAGLLKRGIPPGKLISVDCSPAMVRHLREHFPSIHALVGDAAQLEKLLKDHIDLEKNPVSHVVSSIPLRLLTNKEVRNIAREVRRVLKTGGRFIQYTYDIRPTAHPALDEFKYLGSSVVWMNIPPARVNVYKVPALAVSETV
jgi:phospholipid N-methyltransferase